MFLLAAIFRVHGQQLGPAKYSTFLGTLTPGFYLSAIQKDFNNNPTISLAKNYAVAPLPFFCNVESKLHRRANVWIKLRTGNDESYMRMLSPVH